MSRSRQFAPDQEALFEIAVRVTSEQASIAYASRLKSLGNGYLAPNIDQKEIAAKYAGEYARVILTAFLEGALK